LWREHGAGIVEEDVEFCFLRKEFVGASFDGGKVCEVEMEEASLPEDVG